MSRGLPTVARARKESWSAQTSRSRAGHCAQCAVPLAHSNPVPWRRAVVSGTWVTPKKWTEEPGAEIALSGQRGQMLDDIFALHTLINLPAFGGRARTQPEERRLSGLPADHCRATDLGGATPPAHRHRRHHLPTLRHHPRTRRRRATAGHVVSATRHLHSRQSACRGWAAMHPSARRPAQREPRDNSAHAASRDLGTSGRAAVAQRPSPTARRRPGSP